MSSEAVDCPTVVNEGCDHLIATHFHGTLMCYNEDKCRCVECRAANSRYKKHHRPKWEGEFPRMEHPLVDAAPVVAHVRELMEQGMTYREIAESSVTIPSLYKKVGMVCPLDRPIRANSVTGCAYTLWRAYRPIYRFRGARNAP